MFESLKSCQFWGLSKLTFDDFLNAVILNKLTFFGSGITNNFTRFVKRLGFVFHLSYSESGILMIILNF